MSGGETVRFKHNDVIMQDLTSTPTKVPDKYVVHMLGGHGTDSTPWRYHSTDTSMNPYQLCMVIPKANTVIIVTRMTMITDANTHHKEVHMCHNMLTMLLYILAAVYHSTLGKTWPVQLEKHLQEIWQLMKTLAISTEMFDRL